jgi:hypothetical protein
MQLLTDKVVHRTTYDHCMLDLDLPEEISGPIDGCTVMLTREPHKHAGCNHTGTVHYNIYQQHRADTRARLEQHIDTMVLAKLLGFALKLECPLRPTLLGCAAATPLRSPTLEVQDVAGRGLLAEPTPDPGPTETGERTSTTDCRTRTSPTLIIPTSDLGDLPTPAFPTDEKVRANAKRKENKLQGIKPKKRPKPVELGTDDLGDDLSGLFFIHFNAPSESEDDLYSDESDQGDMSESERLTLTGWPTTALYGVNLTQDTEPDFNYGQPYVPIHDALSFLTRMDKYEYAWTLDCCELCGGAGRTTRLAIRRRLSTGENFDLQTGVNLDSPDEQNWVLKYLETQRVLVVVMSPSCRSTGPPSRLNRAINYDTWEAHYHEDRPHIAFCGKVALFQLDHGRHFFCEQPHPSYIWNVRPWNEVQKRPELLTIRIDQ